MFQFRTKITKTKVPAFRRSGKLTDSRRRPMPACSPVSFKQSRLSFSDIWPHWRPNIRKTSTKNMRVLASLGLVTLVRKPNFQAVIKLAASAASPTAWKLHGSAPKPSPASRSRRPGAPMQLPSRRGGCASSRLDHSLKV